MNMQTALMEWEISRNRRFLPSRSLTGVLLLLLYGFIPTVATFALLYNTELESVIMSVLSITFLATACMFFVSETILRVDPTTEWWLHVPANRMVLVKARYKANCRTMLAVISLMMAGIPCGFGLYTLVEGPVEITGQQVMMCAGLLILALTFVPIQAAFGPFATVLYRRSWWMISFYILYFLLWCSLYGTLFGLSVALMTEEGSGSGWQPSSFTWVLVVLGVAAIGWPLVYVMLRAAARYGLPNLADKRNIEPISWTQDAKGASKAGRMKSRVELQQPKSTFSALCMLERSRISVYAGHWLAKLLYRLAGIGLLIGGYYSYGYTFTIMATPLIVSATVIYVLLMMLPTALALDLQKRTLTWWLNFPVPRWQLLVSRTMVMVTLALRWWVWVYATFWAGLSMRVVLDDSINFGELRTAGQWTLYMMILILLVGVGFVCYLSTLSVINQAHPRLSLFTIMILLSPLLLQSQLSRYLVPKVSLIAETEPYWGRLPIVGVISIGIATVSYLIALRYINDLAMSQPRQGLQTIGK